VTSHDPRDPRSRLGSAGEAAEGWESVAEDADAGSLAPSQELEQALREATDAVEARSAEREGRPHGAIGGDSTHSSRSTDSDDEALRAELAETRDRWIRLNADFENFRRRTLKEREEAYQFGHQALAKDLLPAVDNLERAIDAARKSGVGDLESLLQGLELVRRDLDSVLGKHGVTEVEALGQPFDPSVHEALAQLPDASVPPNTVVQVFQRGYRLRDRLLRPAQVLVSKAGNAGEA
jgi:molecular chaperone GrpE